MITGAIIAVAIYGFLVWTFGDKPQKYNGVWYNPNGSTEVEIKDILKSKQFKSLFRSKYKND